MDILMLSWEYPPISHGGLARHVQDLSETLASQGHSLFIITQGDNNIPGEEEYGGVNIFRPEQPKISPNNFVDSILHLNYQLLEYAIELEKRRGGFDIIHAHDWLVFWSAKVLKHALKLPLVYTIHATEYGRNQGIYNDMQRYINDLEWYACFEAWRVIVCSEYMKNEVKGLFQVPADKIKVIENGVYVDNYKTDYTEEFREKYASPQEYMVFYVGRIVREKGIQVLIQAIPGILSREPSTKFVIAGRGPHLENLKNQARYLGIEDRIYFTGFISDDERNKLYQAADVAVFPSLYEPFGIVALEAMATKTPVVVSDVGGFTEFVTHKETGYRVEPGNPQQLAEAILYMFHNGEEARKMAETGYKMAVNKYSWDNIAARTTRVYERVLQEYRESEWHKKHKNDEPSYIDNEEKMYATHKYR